MKYWVFSKLDSARAKQYHKSFSLQQKSQHLLRNVNKFQNYK
jgi:hypothetical protein